MQKSLISGAAALVFSVSAAFAQVPGNTVKIGVLSDFSGPFADQAGRDPSSPRRWPPKTSRRNPKA